MATREAHFAARTRGAELDGESILGLVKRLMEDLATLFRQEVALATAEVTGALTRLTAGVLSMITGGAILYAGFLVLLASAVLGLSLVVAPWLAALIVGAVVLVIGFVLLAAGRKAADPSILKPRRSQESLRKDKAALSRAVED